MKSRKLQLHGVTLLLKYSGPVHIAVKLVEHSRK